MMAQFSAVMAAVGLICSSAALADCIHVEINAKDSKVRSTCEVCKSGKVVLSNRCGSATVPFQLSPKETKTIRDAEWPQCPALGETATASVEGVKDCYASSRKRKG